MATPERKPRRARRNRTVTLSREAELCLAHVPNVSRYIDEQILDADARWRSGLDELLRRGWTRAELLARLTARYDHRSPPLRTRADGAEVTDLERVFLGDLRAEVDHDNRAVLDALQEGAE